MTQWRILWEISGLKGSSPYVVFRQRRVEKIDKGSFVLGSGF